MINRIVPPKDCFGLSGGLSGNQIKIIGIILMVADHLYYMFNLNGVPAWFHWAGRPVAPIFLFLCAEGFAHTQSRGRYLLRLFIGFEVMNVLSMLLGRILPNENVILMFSIFGSLFYAALYMWFIDLFRDALTAKKPVSAALTVLLMLSPLAYGLVTVLTLTAPDSEMPRWLINILLSFIPNIMTVEAGPIWALLGSLFYILRRVRGRPQIFQIIPLIVFGAIFFIMKNIQWMVIFAVIPVLLYNGTRGRGGAGGKYFFYIFYPAHIYLLYIIAYVIQK